MMLVLSELPPLYPSRTYPVRRAFHRWYAAERMRFANPLRFAHGTDAAIHFRFRGRECLERGVLDDAGISIFAVQNEKDVALLWQRQIPLPVSEPNTIRALHAWVFEPFLAWTNSHAAPSPIA